MNATDPNDLIQQAAFHLSAHLGKLAADLPPPTETPLDPAPPPPRLPVILGHFTRRAQVRKEMHRSLRANGLMAP